MVFSYTSSTWSNLSCIQLPCTWFWLIFYNFQTQRILTVTVTKGSNMHEKCLISKYRIFHPQCTSIRTNIYSRYLLLRRDTFVTMTVTKFCEHGALCKMQRQTYDTWIVKLNEFRQTFYYNRKCLDRWDDSTVNKWFRLCRPRTPGVGLQAVKNCKPRLKLWRGGFVLNFKS